MNYSTIMSHLAKEYEHALKNEWVKKPMSYALYHTWRWCDKYEKGEKENEQKNKL